MGTTRNDSADQKVNGRRLGAPPVLLRSTITSKAQLLPVWCPITKYSIQVPGFHPTDGDTLGPQPDSTPTAATRPQSMNSTRIPEVLSPS